MPVSPLHGDAAMWERLPANDGMMEVANKRVPPLAVLAILTNVMMIEIVVSDAKKLEVAARARKAKLKIIVPTPTPGSLPG